LIGEKVMKKLSIENKARAYDEALEKAKNYYSTTDSVADTELIELIFPELKESEDERMRKWLIDYLDNRVLNSPSGAEKEAVSKSIAWLEKQGKIVDYYEDRLDECACKYFNKGYKHALEKQGDANKEYWRGYREGKQEILDKYAELEKQGEQKLPIEKLPSEMKSIGESLGFTTQEECDRYNQMVSDLIMSDDDKGEHKSADKVAPKYNVGDWLVHNERKHIVKVVNRTPLVYKVVDTLGYHHTIINDAIENNYHLWTIKDAKDGDILSDRYSIVIFRGIGNEKWNDVIDYHIGLFTNSQHLVVQKSLSHWGNINEVTLHLATKEQRGTLMKAMTDEGYTFDFEKKELKKL
jgi:hypothetical protein